jgi:hypothetical protein
MVLGCGLTSVRGDSGEDYEKWTAVCQKHICKEKKNLTITDISSFKRGQYRQSIIWKKSKNLLCVSHYSGLLHLVPLY